MKITWSGFMFGNTFHIRYLEMFFKLFDNFVKVLHDDISDGIPFLYVFFRPCFGIGSQSGYQPLSWSSQFFFWLWRFGFRIVQTVKLFWDVQGEDLVTTLDILVFPNFAATTIFSCLQTETSLPYLLTFPPRTSSKWSNHDK